LFNVRHRPLVMSIFGQTLFGGSRFIRWALSPFILLFGLLIPLLIEQWTPTQIAVMVVLEAMCITLLAGFWLPARLGHWAFRIVTGLVFLFYAGYLVDELTKFKVTGSDGEASPLDALFGFLIIGLPCLWYALLGRFTLQPRETPPEVSESEDDEDDDA